MIKSKKIIMIVSVSLSLPCLILGTCNNAANASGAWVQGPYSLHANPNNYYAPGSFVSDNLVQSNDEASASAASSFGDLAGEGTTGGVGNYTATRNGYWSGGTSSTNGYSIEGTAGVSGNASPASSETTSATSVSAPINNTQNGSGANYNNSYTRTQVIAPASSVIFVTYSGSVQISTTAGEADDSSTDPVKESEEKAGTDPSGSGATGTIGIDINNESTVPTN